MARTCILRAFGLQISCLSLVSRLLLFCFVFVFLLLLKPRPFFQSFFVLRYACAPAATRASSFFFLFFWACRFFSSIFCTITVFFSYIWRVCMSSHGSPFRMVFFDLVTTGRIFYISLRENFDQSIKYESPDFGT